MPKPKEEALQALKQIEQTLAGQEPIVGLLRQQLITAAGWAIAKVVAIDELKIARRQPKTDALPQPPQPELTPAELAEAAEARLRSF